MSERSALEKALIRDRWVIGAALIVAVGLSWTWIVPMARDMYGEMRGSAVWMMPPAWDAWHDLLLFAMWLVMMAGMMLPSAAPTFLLYAQVLRRSPDAQPLMPRVYAFAAGYLAIWTAFSLLATVLQRLLAELLLLSPMMDIRSPVLGGALLITAGLYQLTPFKRSCLQSCRSPAAFIAGHWRRGRAGAFRMGLEHGLMCLGCCWLLMLLLFVGGVMNLVWIAAITVFVLLEKLLPAGQFTSRLSGVLLVAGGIWSAITPQLH